MISFFTFSFTENLQSIYDAGYANENGVPIFVEKAVEALKKVEIYTVQGFLRKVSGTPEEFERFKTSVVDMGQNIEDLKYESGLIMKGLKHFLIRHKLISEIVADDLREIALEPSDGLYFSCKKQFSCKY